jgi:hypothetical protein
LFSATNTFLFLFFRDMNFVDFRGFGQCLAIQPADCGHGNEFWSGVQRAALQTVSLIA